MPYSPQSFDHLLGLEGFSDELLTNHFTLYQGYVTNTNKLLDLQAELVKADKTAAPEFAETRRRIGWEWNGMRLHEHYFSSMSKDAKPLSRSASLAAQLVKDFGSIEQWEKEYSAIAASRGIGWVILVHDVVAKRLLNVWVNEHDTGHLAGAAILLPIDVFEHAYMRDYGLKRADYISGFLRSIDWQIVSQRFPA